MERQQCRCARADATLEYMTERPGHGPSSCHASLADAALATGHWSALGAWGSRIFDCIVISVTRLGSSLGAVRQRIVGGLLLFLLHFIYIYFKVLGSVLVN